MTPADRQRLAAWREFVAFVERERGIRDSITKGGQHVGYTPSISPTVLHRLEDIVRAGEEASDDPR